MEFGFVGKRVKCGRVEIVSGASELCYSLFYVSACERLLLHMLGLKLVTTVDIFICFISFKVHNMNATLHLSFHKSFFNRLLMFWPIPPDQNCSESGLCLSTLPRLFPIKTEIGTFYYTQNMLGVKHVIMCKDLFRPPNILKGVVLNFFQPHCVILLHNQVTILA